MANATTPVQLSPERQQQRWLQVQLVLALPKRAGAAHGVPHPQQSPTLVSHRSPRHRAPAQQGEDSQSPREYQCEAKGRGKISHFSKKY